MLKKYLTNSKNINTFSKKYISYLQNVFNSLDFKKLDDLEREFLKIRARNSTIFSIGNGGASATSMTLANDVGFDILKKTKKKGFRIVNLCDNNSIITAIANDVGYEKIFIEQLKLHYKKNDALIIFSASGNSKNILNAAKWVREKKGKVFSIVGFDGGKIKNIQIFVYISNLKNEYGPVEDCQLIVNHILLTGFKKNLKNRFLCFPQI